MKNIISDWLDKHGDPKVDKKVKQKLKKDMEKYKITMHRYEGRSYEDFKYTLWINKSFNNTLRMRGIEYGMDLFEKKERMSKVRFYFYKLWQSILGK